MKKLSDTYKKLGIAFDFPIEIKDEKGNETYYENSNGYWERSEYDANGKNTHYENSNDTTRGTPRSSCVGKIIKVEAGLDDRAFAVGDFIQQLSEVQDQKFEALWKECKEKEWIKGMNEATAKDWLFDYLFNGWGIDSIGFQKTFSEYVGAEWE